MTAAPETAARRRPWLVRRWPTIAGIVLAAGLTAAAWRGIVDLTGLAHVLAAAGLVYLGAAALGRRDAAWPLFGVTFVVIGVGLLVPGVDATVWMLVLAAILVVYGLLRGALRPPWGLPLQSLAMLVILAVVLAATRLMPPWGGILIGVGLLAHAGWDVYHHRTGRVVARSMAEFCAVLDTLLAIVVIVVALVALVA